MKTTLFRTTGIFTLFLIQASWTWGLTIETDRLKAELNSQGIRISTQGIVQDTPLGRILLPDSDRLMAIDSQNFPDMQVTQSTPQRMDLSIPSPKQTFYLSLEVQDNVLYAAFDTRPISDVKSPKTPSPKEMGSLEALRQPRAFAGLSLLPDLIQVDRNEDGALVFPYQEGALISSQHPVDKPRDFVLFENSGLTMPFWGSTTQKSSVFCLVDYLYTFMAYDPTETVIRLYPKFVTDPQGEVVRLQFHFLGEGKNYLDLAKKYRAILQDRGELPSLEKKFQEKPQLIHLLEGVNIKFPIYMKHEQKPDANGVTPPARVHKYQTFEDVVDILRDMKEQGLDKAMAVWWGWGKEGYDRLHPDFLPPNPELGGVEAFKKASEGIDRLGFAVGFHDNFTDIYEAAPSFENGIHCTVGADGKNLRGGFWAGGQCWLLCSTEGLKYAQRNFAEMESYGPIHACFIDVLTAAPLFDCYSETHPHSKWGDMMNKRAMMESVSEHFGIMGTEHGFSWGADLCDYFEGVVYDPHNENEWFSGFGASVPLMATVYHDGVVLYPHQGATVHPDRPNRLLYNLRSGGSSYFNVTKPQYNKPEWKDYFLRTARLSSNVIKRTWKLPLTSHEFLNEERTAEKVTYGDEVTIVINTSDQEYVGTMDRKMNNEKAEGVTIQLAPHGFAVAAPGYSAFYGSQWGDEEMNKDTWVEKDEAK